MENKLLEQFGVNSYAELMDFIKNNPESEDVKMLIEFMEFAQDKDTKE